VKKAHITNLRAQKKKKKLKQFFSTVQKKKKIIKTILQCSEKEKN
jgi:hypothetical protein